MLQKYLLIHHFQDNCGDNSDENWKTCGTNAANPNAVPRCAFERTLEECGITMDINEKINFNWKIQNGIEDMRMLIIGAANVDHTT